MDKIISEIYTGTRFITCQVMEKTSGERYLLFTGPFNRKVIISKDKVEQIWQLLNGK